MHNNLFDEDKPEHIGMEAHLATELSNPHSTVKKQARWRTRQLYLRLLKTKILQDEKANSMGRTRTEIAEDSKYKWRAAISEEVLFEKKRRSFHAKRVTAIIHKRARRRRRENINKRRFNAFKLQEGRNQVIPEI